MSPSVSRKQQMMMGAALAMKRGKKMKHPSKELKDMSEHMSEKQLMGFALTKRKGLPLRKSIKLSKKNKKIVSY